MNKEMIKTLRGLMIFAAVIAVVLIRELNSKKKK